MLSLGLAGGGVSTLILRLLSDWASSTGIPSSVVPSSELKFDCNCPNTLWLTDISEREIIFLLVGLLVGILLLPLLELILVLRQAWSVWLRGKILPSRSVLYREL